MVKKEDISIGGSIFWILMVLISLTGLSYLLVWSFHNDSVKGVVVSVVFVTLIISGILLSRLKIFDYASWGDNTLSFSIGFFIWFAVGKFFGPQSILSISQNYLFASIASDLPQLIEIIMNVFIIPISEEIFWMFGIPFSLITIMTVIGEKYSLWKNLYLQMFVVIVVASVTFAIFHVGKFFISFIIAAMLFRTIMIVLVYGDYNFNILKGVNLVAAFAVGAHIANNLIDVGIGKTWLVLSTNIPVLLMIVVFFGIIFLSAIDRILKFILGKTMTLEDTR
jgi:hypothetical protein